MAQIEFNSIKTSKSSENIYIFLDILLNICIYVIHLLDNKNKRITEMEIN